MEAVGPAHREKPADLPVRQGGRLSGPTDRTGLRGNATGLWTLPRPNFGY
jgi:hypothetical protein